MKFCDLIIFVGCLGAASTSSALSLGASQGSVFLGSNVDLVFHVQADPGQTADSSCVNAEVWLGDVRLGSSQVQLQALSDTSVRVRTLQAVNEPLVNVKLTAGCAGAISRSYPFFADPPLSMAASVKPIDLSSIQVASLPPASTSLTPPTTGSMPSAIKAKPKPAKRAVHPQPAPSASTPTAATGTPPAAVDATAPAQAPSAEAAAASAGVTTAAAAAHTTEQPKLRMEALDGLVPPFAQETAETSLSPDANAESLPRGTSIDANTQMLMDASARRLELLEQQLLAMQSTLTNNRTEITALRTQLAQTQNEGLPLWVNVMLGLLALALATIAWLLQRIKQERAHAQARWADTVLAAQDEPPASATPAVAVPAASTTQEAPAATAGSWASILSASESASTHPHNSALAPVPATDESSNAHWLAEVDSVPAAAATPAAPTLPETTSAEQAQASWADVLTAQALFDIQEQAEFYASVGEHDQAILLLEEHIAQNESSSPLAYLELLQLLYRLSRTEAFEHVSTKFQRHFNVQVPSFLRFARKGHDLWSSHPEVLSEIEALWPTDNVLPLLRKLILAKPQAQHLETETRFDLAAFDDLLMLYNVAQTTPAATRGSIAGRIRTAPHVAPLPEVVQDDSMLAAHTEFMPDDVFFKSSLSPASSKPAPLTAPELPSLHAASLEMLSAAPAQAPLSANAPTNDSPFQKTSHFSNAEVLMDGLTIDWEHSDAPTAPVPPMAAENVPPLADFALSDPLSNDALLNDPLLNDPLLSETAMSELQLNELMVDERDLPPGIAPTAPRTPH